MRALNIVGELYGNLTVIETFSKPNPSGRKIRFARCKCICGNETTTYVNLLRKGRTTSCGCKRKEVTGDRARIHGQAGTRLHKIWKNMRQRCCNPNNNVWEYYGGRGISICGDWDDFEVFKSWAETSGYKEDLTIDRINTNGNYEPTNCRWVTRKVQANNRNPRRR